MVLLEAVRISNAKLKNLPPGLVAVFGKASISPTLLSSADHGKVGGTSGIAESTLKHFYRCALKPRIYIVGRQGSPISIPMADLI